MSEKALQCAEVQRAICKVPYYGLEKQAQQGGPQIQQLQQRDAQRELNEYLMMTFFLLCMLLQGSPHLTNGNLCQVYYPFFLKNPFFLKSYVINGGAQAIC